MSSEWMALWAFAFLDTILAETPIYVLMLRPRLGVMRALLMSLGLQLVTHPVLWLAWPELSPHVDYVPLVISAEVLVVIAEGLLVAMVLGPQAGRSRWGWAMLVSLAANAFSTALGFLPSTLRDGTRIGIAVAGALMIGALASSDGRQK